MANERCICCGHEAKFNILLAFEEDVLPEARRYHLPNQHARDVNGPNPVFPVWFCHACMRHIEDNLRATVAYLISEGGAVSKPGGHNATD